MLTMWMPILADNNRVITFDQLPTQAQVILKQQL